MVSTNRLALINIRDKLAQKGLVDFPMIGEPVGLGDKVAAAIILDRGRVDETTLSSPREIHEITIRVYTKAAQLPTENAEFKLDEVRAQIMADIFGDFDLGGHVAYAEPAQFSWNYGYQLVGQTQYRILDLTVVYRVDDNAVFSK